MTLEHNLAHVATGLESLIYDLRRVKVQGLAQSYLEEIQELEDAIFDQYIGTMIRDAQGVALDRLGALVTQPRENRTDNVYRTWILARALVLRSSGRGEELIAIARMVLPADVGVKIVEEFPAALTIRLVGVVDNALGTALSALLQKARGISIRLLTSWTSTLTPFRYSATGVSIFSSPNGYDAGGYASS
jgi:hypothetical protein